MPNRITLVSIEGAYLGKRFILDENMNCIVGREADCGIHIPDSMDDAISRHHCRIHTEFPDRVTVRDLRSGNGTFVNDVKIDPGHFEGDGVIPVDHDIELKTGDRLRIGQTVFKVVLD